MLLVILSTFLICFFICIYIFYFAKKIIIIFFLEGNLSLQGWKESLIAVYRLPIICIRKRTNQSHFICADKYQKLIDQMQVVIILNA